MYDATKIVIITERSILDGVAALIMAGGATGYTHVDAGGRGSRGKRSANRPGVGGVLSNVKIEAIVSDAEKAEAIIQTIADRYFEHYSGIAYVEPVHILRPHKFAV
ncbi:P-II family nitrogen regulator [Gymnodinialimonas hymeniacidonis]|uniref:P-II family nitrogen regulator n=1 Tax=Gymnodinialimonas hymeniacidonis TaxID=3126508 RepID=UPI0034C5E997